MVKGGEVGREKENKIIKSKHLNYLVSLFTNISLEILIGLQCGISLKIIIFIKAFVKYIFSPHNALPVYRMHIVNFICDLI